MNVLHPETVTIVRSTGRAFGGDSTGETSTDVGDCAVLPRDTGAEAVTFNQDVVTIDMTIVVPSGTDVLVTDDVIVRSIRFHVARTPIPLKSPHTGRDSGIGVALKTFTG